MAKLHRFIGSGNRLINNTMRFEVLCLIFVISFQISEPI